VKFSCERCGKRYATADTLAPGRVYKLKCKACGHLIVVKASASTAASMPAQAVEADAPSRTPPPAPPSLDGPAALQLEIDRPAAAAPPNGAFSGQPQPFGNATTEVSMTPTATPPPVAVPPDEEFRPPPGDTGYVDLFADLGLSGAAPAAEPPREPDPFLSEPSAPDPFELLRGEPSPLEPAAASVPAGLKIPVIPKPPPQKSHLPFALIGAGLAVLVGILAFVLVGSGSKEARTAAPPPAVVQAPVPPRLTQPAQEPPPPSREAAPPAAESPPPATPAAQPQAEPDAEPPRKAAGDDRRAREDQRREREEAQAREREARQVREREAKERQAREREAKEREERDRERRERERLAAAAAQEEAEAGLSPGQIESVLLSTKKAFDGCMQAARGTEVKLDGRRVMLRLNIQPSGTVTYPTLDDVTLNGTDVGSCLKSAARLMVFPKFKGDTLHVEVPLVMR